MIKKLRLFAGLITMMWVILLIFPISILAQEPGNNVDQAVNVDQSVNIEAEKGINQISNGVTPQNDENAAVIKSLEQVPDINSDDNLDQQVVVIYANGGETNVEDLSLTTDEVVSGDKVSNRVDVIKVSDTTNVDELMAELEKNPNVLAVDKNEKIEVAALPNDPYIVDGSAWQFERIGADQTWSKISNTEPIVVAVIDTGINVNHPDLIGKTVYGYDFVTAKSGVVDIAGHGTEVSGCIAAVTNNGIGTAGVTGTSNIKIAPYRVGGEYAGDNNLDLAYICAAILEAAKRPEVKVINMSFGGYGTFTSLAAAVQEAVSAGKIIVAASGNEGGSTDVHAGQYLYPASYANVISVGATTKDNVRASYSQYNDQVDLCAPGQAVLTTTTNGSYGYASGTSFSSPIVAGACAVLLAADSSLNSGEVESILKSTALDLGNPGKDSYYGNGMIQLDEAVASLTPVETVSSTYRTHVQNIGWQSWKNNGEVSGTSGQSLRLEGIEIKMNTDGYDLGVEYQTQVQNIGWQGWKSNGQTSGTSGKSLRLEAIQIRLTGADADQYDVYYQVHCQNYGWLDWAKNGESAGSEGLSLRLEAIKIQVLPKGSPAPGPTTRPFVTGNIYCNYRTHVQNIGWQSWRSRGEISGTSGQSLRLEGIEIKMNTAGYDLGVEYQTQVQNIGWQGWKSNGQTSGTFGKSLRLEAIQIRLTGADADQYDVYYQVHSQSYGWLDWAKNGESAGSEGLSLRLEAIKIQVLPKGSPAPGPTTRPFIK